MAAVTRGSVIAVVTDGMCACVSLCFTHVSGLISNAVNSNSYNPHVHRLWVLDNFQERKGFLRPQILRAVGPAVWQLQTPGLDGWEPAGRGVAWRAVSACELS